jgi:hypothetical protein
MMITSNVTQGTSTSSVTTGYVPTFTNGGPSVHEAVTGSTTEKIMIFRNSATGHVFTVPSGGLNCDILMIGGGGGARYGGGGAGACIVAINQTLPAGDCYLGVGLGRGGYEGPNNGNDSYITFNVDRYIAKGGGSCTSVNLPGNSGGCGAGADASLDATIDNGGAAVSTNVVNGSTATIGPSITSTYAVMGNAGGNNGGSTNLTGGGGGIGTPGVNSGGKGGDGAYQVAINGTTYNFRNYFANGGNNFGVQNGSTSNYYIGGGGGGYNFSANAFGANGLGGTGGGSGNNGTGSAGYGGTIGADGIVIIRYRSSSTTTYTHTPTTTTTLSTPTLGTPSIELVRGTQGDSNTDYKIGNYNGDFIVKSSVSSLDTDYLKISSTGAITNPTGTASWFTGSDRRIKENIERASYDKCYESICRLELNRFNYIKGFNTVNRDITQLGFIAQEVNDIFPKAITSQAYYSDVLSIPDLLSIDVSQINYALYGTVKKLIEINNNKELRLKKLECLLNIESDSGSNLVISESVLSSNVVISEDTMSSNVVIEDVLSSNVVISESVLSSNVVIIEDAMSSNVVISEDTMSSNVVVIEDVLGSNVVIEDVLSSNVVIEDVLSSNVVVEDTMTSNVVIMDDVLSSNVVIEDTNNI